MKSSCCCAGLAVSVETCPHYLNFANEKVPDGDTRYKCAPPLRASANQDKLWEYLVEGKINTLASDHSPAPPEMKLLEQGDFKNSWGGIAGMGPCFAPTCMSLGTVIYGSDFL